MSLPDIVGWCCVGATACQAGVGESRANNTVQSGHFLWRRNYTIFKYLQNLHIQYLQIKQKHKVIVVVSTASLLSHDTFVVLQTTKS